MPSSRPAGKSRRTLLTAGGVGAAGLALSGCGSEDSGTSSPSGSSAAAAGGAATVAAADVPVGGGAILTDAKVVVTQPTEGEFKAFSAVCTHEGCVVSGVTETIDCACHNSKFSVTDGSVVSGPATASLPAKTVTADGDSLSVS
ncbi:MAG: Rieske (2Fe-2S) protein [Tetrasphaera sp.]